MYPIMPQNLEFLAKPPFIFTVTGKPAKIALGNKGFRPQVAGENDRFTYWLHDNESAIEFRKAIVDCEIYALQIF